MGESCEQGRVKVIGEQPLRGHVDGSERETRGQGNGAALEYEKMVKKGKKG